MKWHFKQMYWVGILLLATGCATHDNFVKTYNSWIGRDINNFTKQYGYPDTTYKLSNGNTVYVYEKKEISSNTALYPAIGYGRWGYYGGIGIGYGGDIEYEECKLFLEVDNKEKIKKWGYKGNGCRV